MPGEWAPAVAPGRPTGPVGPVAEDLRFRRAFARVPAAVAVLLTCEPDGAVRGITCTSAGSLSADPPMAIACVDQRTGLAPVIEAAGRFSVNYLAGDREWLARAFATAGRSLDGLGPVVVDGRTGVPVLASGTVAVVECTLEAMYRGGDHWVLHGLVRHARSQPDADPLVHRAGRYSGFSPVDDDATGREGITRAADQQ